MRIQHAVDDQVIFLVGRAEEVPRIVDRQCNARVVIRPLGVILGPEKRDGRIDFDGIDMGSPHPQRGRDVIAAARADNGHALRRFIEIVREFVVGAHIAIRARLQTTLGVGKIVDLLIVASTRQDLHQSIGFGGSLQQLVRRIDALGLGLHGPSQDRQQNAKACDPEWKEIVAREHEQQHDPAHRAEPDHGRQPVEAHHEQGDDPENAAHQIEAIRVQRIRAVQ